MCVANDLLGITFNVSLPEGKSNPFIVVDSRGNMCGFACYFQEAGDKGKSPPLRVQASDRGVPGRTENPDMTRGIESEGLNRR